MQNILIADDNKMIRDSLSSYLTHQFQNYTVLTAEDGEQAIQTMDSVPVSLVLTDLEMPKVDGYGVIMHAKKHHPNMPVGIMTGSWTPDLRMLVHKLDVIPCIEKPFRFEEVARMVENLLEKKEAATPGTLPYGGRSRLNVA
jgi:two-component system response regulator PilR (NtrC family)